MGGSTPASVGAFREVYQEGVIIPPVKLVQGGQMVDDIFWLMLAQIRSKNETGGDFAPAQIAANNTGVQQAKYSLGAAGTTGDGELLRRRTDRLYRAPHAG